MAPRSPLMRQRKDTPAGMELHLGWRSYEDAGVCAAPLERVAEILGVPLEVCIAAAQQVPPYTTATGEPVWSVHLVGLVLGVRKSPRRAQQIRDQRKQQRRAAG